MRWRIGARRGCTSGGPKSKQHRRSWRFQSSADSHILITLAALPAGCHDLKPSVLRFPFAPLNSRSSRGVRASVRSKGKPGTVLLQVNRQGDGGSDLHTANKHALLAGVESTDLPRSSRSAWPNVR